MTGHEFKGKPVKEVPVEEVDPLPTSTDPNDKVSAPRVMTKRELLLDELKSVTRELKDSQVEALIIYAKSQLGR